jgi:hypothetical protein
MSETFSRWAILRAGGLTAGALTFGIGVPAWAADRVDAFVTRHQGRHVDYDGYPSGNPYQCFDLWVFYAWEVAEVSGVLQATYGPTPGYAASIWDSFDYKDGIRNWNFGMMAGTSPALATYGNAYQVAAQANTGSLWILGNFGNRNWELGMMGGSSPSITTLSDGAWVAAMQANTGSLITAGTAGPRTGARG